MPFYRLRMLRNPEDASPGGGAAPTTPPASTTTTQPQAQGGVLPNGGDLASTLKEFRNGLFADVRGMVEKIVEQKTTKAPTTPPGATTPPAGEQRTASPGMTLEEVNRLIVKRDSLADAIAGYPEPTRNFLRAQFAKENPEDVSAWVTGYATAFGISKGAPAPAGAGTQPPPAGAAPGTVQPPPISDKGPPTGNREFEQITNPNELTASDIERLQAKRGEEKANDMIREMARRYLRDKRFVPGK